MAPRITVLLATILVCSSAPGMDIPFLTGRVNDNAAILSPKEVSGLEASLKAFEDSTSNQVVVLTIPTLDGESLEEYSYKVASTWKLGQKGKDNGVLLLVVRDDRKVRIEVGSGLEGDLTDLLCGLIIRREILPAFKGGNMDAGVRAGVNAIMGVIRGTYSQDETSSSETLPMILGFSLFLFVVGIFTFIALCTSGFQSWFLFVFLIPFWLAFPSVFFGFTTGIILLGIYLIGFPIGKSLLRHSMKGKQFMTKWGTSLTSGSHGSGGSSGGSSFSGGGGSFSGGGASGSW